MADQTATDLQYEIQILLFGAWSVLGVLSGIATIAGASWALRLQTVLMAILKAFLVFCVVALLYIVVFTLVGFLAG